jgi:hypothetical protein
MKLRALPLLLVLAACSGPRGSPDGSVKAFYNAAADADFEEMNDILAEESRKKLGSNSVAKLANMFGGWSKVDITIDESMEDSNGKTATVRFTCMGSSFENYKLKQYDCSDVLQVVKEDDGKWHIVLAGGRTLRPM